MRQPHLQISEERQLGAGTGDLLEVERRRDQRLLEDRPLCHHVAPRRPHDRSAGKCLPSLEPHQLREGDEDAVLARDVLDDAAPAAETRRAARATVVSWHRPPRGAGTGHDDELGAIQCREHRGERMPDVLADQDRRPAPGRVERLDAPAGLDETLLVEDTVGRQEHLPVDMANPGIGAAQPGIDRRVVEAVLVDLVEAQGDVERRRLRVAVLSCQIVE